MTSLDLFRLDGQTAVVVGGAGGLGAAMARGLAEAGAAVAVADFNAGQAKVVADGIAKNGGRALAVAVDVADRASVERMAAEVEARLGAIDVLVNSAGITHRSPAAAFPEAEWHRVLAVNLSGVFWGCQVVGQRMLARRRGSIVNIASIAGEIGLTGTVAYAASKGGVVMLTRALAVEWAPQNVRVNAIAPSWFRVQHRRPDPPRAQLRGARDAPCPHGPHGQARRADRRRPLPRLRRLRHGHRPRPRSRRRHPRVLTGSGL